MKSMALEIIDQAENTGMDVAAIMEHLEASEYPKDQDWEDESTRWIMPDGSTIKIRAGEIILRGQPRKAITRPRIGPFTVAPETAAALEADRREGESKGAVIDRWARERQK